MKNRNLVAYIRDYTDIIHGCLVAIDKERIGVCLVKPKGNFSKKKMVNLATERAYTENFENLFIPDRIILPEWADLQAGQGWMEFQEVVNLSYLRLKGRAERWFKEC